jgi:hypothetical protein
MQSVRFYRSFTNAFGPVRPAFVSKQNPLRVKLSSYLSNSKAMLPDQDGSALTIAQRLNFFPAWQRFSLQVGTGDLGRSVVRKLIED